MIYYIKYIYYVYRSIAARTGRFFFFFYHGGGGADNNARGQHATSREGVIILLRLPFPLTPPLVFIPFRAPRPNLFSLIEELCLENHNVRARPSFVVGVGT